MFVLLHLSVHVGWDGGASLPGVWCWGEVAVISAVVAVTVVSDSFETIHTRI